MAKLNRSHLLITTIFLVLGVVIHDANTSVLKEDEKVSDTATDVSSTGTSTIQESTTTGGFTGTTTGITSTTEKATTDTRTSTMSTTTTTEEPLEEDAIWEEIQLQLKNITQTLTSLEAFVSSVTTSTTFVSTSSQQPTVSSTEEQTSTSSQQPITSTTVEISSASSQQPTLSTTTETASTSTEEPTTPSTTVAATSTSTEEPTTPSTTVAATSTSTEEPTTPSTTVAATSTSTMEPTTPSTTIAATSTSTMEPTTTKKPDTLQKRKVPPLYLLQNVVLEKLKVGEDKDVCHPKTDPLCKRLIDVLSAIQAFTDKIPDIEEVTMTDLSSIRKDTVELTEVSQSIENNPSFILENIDTEEFKNRVDAVSQDVDAAIDDIQERLDYEDPTLAIVLGTLGGILGVAIIVGGIVMYRKKKNKKKNQRFDIGMHHRKEEPTSTSSRDSIES